MPTIEKQVTKPQWVKTNLDTALSVCTSWGYSVKSGAVMGITKYFAKRKPHNGLPVEFWHSISGCTPKVIWNSMARDKYSKSLSLN